MKYDFPANPVPTDSCSPGLSKREYFAVIAMQALLSNGDWIRPTAAADTAVRVADKLFEELNKT